ncbi:MAG: phosphate ABC transporter ATP-binding protein [Candidatus Omnitrophica bacterium]|nr:phosphate ABC transporter ATP-binding protein [Candidatus Omnitrophota bacterium]
MIKISLDHLNLYYGSFPALKNVSTQIKANQVTAIIGPSGCGKSTLLRCINRMNEVIADVKVEGTILVDGEDILRKEADLRELRRRIGMVFQRPNPFPLAVFDNVAYGPWVHRIRDQKELEQRVQESLVAVGLWDVLKDRLDAPALKLSSEQQQRLCIARLVATRSEILLMDEPCSALDPIATAKIEELIYELKKKYTIVLVTHNMQQAARISDETGFMLLGELVEFGVTDRLFTAPQDQKTEEYITGRYG